MTTTGKFQRHSFEVAFQLTAKLVRSHILTFGIFENRITGSGSYEDLIIGAGAAARATGAGTFCPEPEPEPPNSFTWSRSWSRGRSRIASLEPEPEPEPTKNVTAPHPGFHAINLEHKSQFLLLLSTYSVRLFFLGDREEFNEHQYRIALFNILAGKHFSYTRGYNLQHTPPS